MDKLAINWQNFAELDFKSSLLLECGYKFFYSNSDFCQDRIRIRNRRVKRFGVGVES